MSIDLPHFIESAVDEVATVGRAAAGTISELAHDWGSDARSIVGDLAPVLPLIGTRGRRSVVLHWRWMLPAAVLGVVAMVMVRRRRRRSVPHLSERQFMPTVNGTTDERAADALRADAAAAG